MFSLVIERLLTALLSFFFVFGRATNVKSACVTMNPFERTLLGTQLCGSPHKIFSGPLGVFFFFCWKRKTPTSTKRTWFCCRTSFSGKRTGKIYSVHWSCSSTLVKQIAPLNQKNWFIQGKGGIRTTKTCKFFFIPPWSPNSKGKLECKDLRRWTWFQDKPRPAKRGREARPPPPVSLTSTYIDPHKGTEQDLHATVGKTRSLLVQFKVPMKSLSYRHSGPRSGHSQPPSAKHSLPTKPRV